MTLEFGAEPATNKTVAVLPKLSVKDSTGNVGATVETPSFLSTSEPSVQAGSTSHTDWTDDTDQLGLSIGGFSYTGNDGVVVKIPVGENGEIDFSDVPISSIASLNMEFDFSILKDGEERLIKPGDFFKFTLPSIFKVVQITEPVNIVDARGETIASFTIDNSNTCTVTFADVVNYETGSSDIRGGINCEFTLVPGQFSEGGTTA